jgi:hypothetical protein
MTIAFTSLRKWTGDVRYTVLFVMMFAIIWNVLAPVAGFCRATQYRVNPFLYVFLSNQIINQLILLSGIVFLFSNAPFMDYNQPFVLVRSGRSTWVLGQVLYIVVGSALYFLVLMAFSVVVLTPIATFATNGWGKIVNTLAYTDAAQQFQINGLWVSTSLVNLYTPLQAFSLCFVLQWLAGSFIGLLMFAVNSVSNSKIGNYAASLLILMDILVYNVLPFHFLYFSPASLSRLGLLNPLGTTRDPSVLYALAFFGVGILVWSGLSVLSVRKKPIDLILDL